MRSGGIDSQRAEAAWAVVEPVLVSHHRTLP